MGRMEKLVFGWGVTRREIMCVCVVCVCVCVCVACVCVCECV